MSIFQQKNFINKIGLTYGWKSFKNKDFLISQQFILNLKIYWCLQEYTKYLNFFINMWLLVKTSSGKQVVYLFIKKKSLTFKKQFYYKKKKVYWKGWHPVASLPFSSFRFFKKIKSAGSRLHFFFDPKPYKVFSYSLFKNKIYRFKRMFLKKKRVISFFKSSRIYLTPILFWLVQILSSLKFFKTKFYKFWVRFELKRLRYLFFFFYKPSRFRRSLLFLFQKRVKFFLRSPLFKTVKFFKNKKSRFFGRLRKKKITKRRFRFFNKKLFKFNYINSFSNRGPYPTVFTVKGIDTYDNFFYGYLPVENFYFKNLKFFYTSVFTSLFYKKSYLFLHHLIIFLSNKKFLFSKTIKKSIQKIIVLLWGYSLKSHGRFSFLKLDRSKQKKKKLDFSNFFYSFFSIISQFLPSVYNPAFIKINKSRYFNQRLPVYVTRRYNFLHLKSWKKKHVQTANQVVKGSFKKIGFFFKRSDSNYLVKNFLTRFFKKYGFKKTKAFLPRVKSIISKQSKHIHFYKKPKKKSRAAKKKTRQTQSRVSKKIKNISKKIKNFVVVNNKYRLLSNKKIFNWVNCGRAGSNKIKKKNFELSGVLKNLYHKKKFLFSWSLESLIQRAFEVPVSVKLFNSSRFLTEKNFFNVLGGNYDLNFLLHKLGSKKIIASLSNFKFYYNVDIIINDVRDEFKKTRHAIGSLSLIHEVISSFLIPNIKTYQTVLRGKTAKLSRAQNYISPEMHQGVPILNSNEEVIHSAANTWAKLGTYGIHLWFHYVSNPE